MSHNDKSVDALLDALSAFKDHAETLYAAWKPVIDMIDRGEFACEWHPGYKPDNEPDWTNYATTHEFLTQRS